MKNLITKILEKIGLKKTLAQKALTLLSQIPEEDFITGRFTDAQGKCCAIGHFQRLTSKNPLDYSASNCQDWDNKHNKGLRELTKNFIFKKHDMYATSIAEVNNNTDINGYTEPIIKDRVIHLLTDMVKEGL